MHLIREYINYIRKAQGRHQIHSPFVYNFVDSCLKTTIPKAYKNKTKQFTQRLSSNHTTIKTTDFGAGSKKMGQIRTVSSIYKNACCKGTYAHLLYKLCNYYQPKYILELGTNLGVGTFFLHEGNPNSKIVSVDGCTETQSIAKQNLTHTNLLFVHSKFEDFLKNLEPQKFDLIYIDGDHRGEALLKYLKMLENYSHDDTIFVLDDIRWSKDMFEAWKTIIASKDFHLTLDLFKMGIIMKKSGKEKEHFTIKLKNVLTSL